MAHTATKLRLATQILNIIVAVLNLALLIPPTRLFYNSRYTRYMPMINDYYINKMSALAI